MKKTVTILSLLSILFPFFGNAAVKVQRCQSQNLRKLNVGESCISSANVVFRLVDRIQVEYKPVCGSQVTKLISKEFWIDTSTGVIWGDINDGNLSNRNEENCYGNSVNQQNAMALCTDYKVIGSTKLSEQRKFRLPTQLDYQKAYKNGFLEVLPNLSNDHIDNAASVVFWTSTIDAWLPGVGAIFTSGTHLKSEGEPGYNVNQAGEIHLSLETKLLYYRCVSDTK